LLRAFSPTLEIGLHEPVICMRISFFALLAALAFCEGAEADAPPPDSLKMTCAQAQNYIVRNDGAVLATGNAYASFHSSYCSGQPAFVRTKDAQYCYVGQYCDCELTYCAQSFFQGDRGPAR
jgi:hypothetical protein